jgi:hypothetical protein
MHVLAESSSQLGRKFEWTVKLHDANYFIEKSVELNNKFSWAMKNQDKDLTKSLI